MRETKKEQVVEFDCQGRLPAPAVSKGSARYEDVYDGADLVVESLRSGFETLLEFADADSVDEWLSADGARRYMEPESTDR